MSLTANYYLKKKYLFVRLKGELDQETCSSIRNKLCELIERYDVKNLVLNLEGLDFMDSSGIGVILGRYNQLKRKGGKIILCALNKYIEKIVLLAGLPRICTLKENEECAYEYLEAIYD